MDIFPIDNKRKNSKSEGNSELTPHIQHTFINMYVLIDSRNVQNDAENTSSHLIASFID